jgi:hypothetical protein
MEIGGLKVMNEGWDGASVHLIWVDCLPHYFYEQIFLCLGIVPCSNLGGDCCCFS